MLQTNLFTRCTADVVTMETPIEALYKDSITTLLKHHCKQFRTNMFAPMEAEIEHFVNEPQNGKCHFALCSTLEEYPK